MNTTMRHVLITLISAACGLAYHAGAQTEKVIPGKKCTNLGNCPGICAPTPGKTAGSCWYCLRQFSHGHCDVDGTVCYKFTWGPTWDCGYKVFGTPDSFGCCVAAIPTGTPPRCSNVSCT